MSTPMTPELARKRAEEILSKYREDVEHEDYPDPGEAVSQILTLAADVAEACAPKRRPSTVKAFVDGKLTDVNWVLTERDHAIDDMYRAASLYREASKWK